MTSKKTIIFVTYGGGHVSMLIPVIKQLQQNKKLKLIILGLTTAGSVLSEHSIPYIGFNDLLEPDNTYARSWGQRLVGEKVEGSIVPYEESVAYMGLSYVDLEIEHGEKKAAELYAIYGRQVFNPLLTIKKFLKSESPDILVATNSPRAERAAINVAKQLGIPSLCLVDLFAIQEVTWIGKPSYADKVCVFSDYVKSMFIEHGRYDHEIVVTGNPVFDSLEKYQGRTGYFRQKFSFESKKKVVLWASQPEPKIHPISGQLGDPMLTRKIENSLVEIARKNVDFQFIFRLHPSEDRSYSSLPDNVYVSDASDNIYEILSLSDVVITMSSTVGFEAFILGKDLITIDLSVVTEDVPYSKMGISHGLTSLEDIEPALKKIKKMVEPKVKVTVNATQNVVNNILNLIV